MQDAGTHQRFGSLLFRRIRRLTHSQRFDNESFPLLHRPQLPRVRPVKNCPQLIVRILYRCSCQPEPPRARKLVVRPGNLGPRVFDTMHFIDYDNRPV
jgi:hypothetical protein